MAEVVVVTGASAGIGRAVAREFAFHGARVVLLARSAIRLESAADEVRAAGGHPLAIPVDVADAVAVDAAAERVETEFGPIDVWINSAMVTVFSPADRMTPEEYRRVTEVTYLGTVHGTLAALRHMRPRRRGTVVQVGSALSYRAIPLQSAYCAAKFAVRGFTDAVRIELAHEHAGINVTMVQLAAFNTPQFEWARNKVGKRAQPLPPIFEPEVAARGIRFAAYARRREVCVGMPAVVAIWGNKLAPHIADRKLLRTAFDGQTTDEPLRTDGGDNLFEPPPGNPGIHGRFSRRTKSHSWQLLWSMHRAAGWTAVVVLTGIAAAVIWWARHGAAIG